MRMHRRRWLTTTALGAVFAAARWAPVRPQEVTEGGVPLDVVPTAPWFTPDERAFVEAAVERLIPADDLGPGGVELGVVDFIDRQLGGPFGRAARWYMEGPFREGYEDQGYQVPFTPAELYRHCIPKANAWARERFRAAFAELPPAERDTALGALEAGEVPLDIAQPELFFAMLLRNAKEGYLADPIYGGNRDFAAWRLIGFPGARYDYAPFIVEHGQPFPLPPVGVMGRDGRPLWELR
jgi:gluconate 2-dehydrogenase gamma chain